MIFVHNTWNRTKVLYRNIQEELRCFPDANAIVLYNNEKLKVDNNICEHIYVGKNEGHKLACVNLAMKAIDILVERNEDILVFSHDDLFLSNPDKFKKVLNKPEGFIARRYLGNGPNHGLCVMMETFVIKYDYAKNVNTTSFKSLSRSKRGTLSPETSFGERLTLNDAFFFDFNINRYGENELGYYHIDYIRGQDE